MNKQLLAAGFLTVLSSLAMAAPANQAGIAASTINLYRFSDSASVQTLLTTEVKTPDKKDLAIDVSMECAIGTTNSDFLLGFPAAADTYNFGFVNVWIEIDGTPIPVSSDDPSAAGVFFCGSQLHHFRDDYTGANSIEQRTNYSLGANSFKWFAVNVPAGTHTVEVKALLVASADAYSVFGNDVYANTVVAVGKRTMEVSPIHLGPKVTLP